MWNLKQLYFTKIGEDSINMSIFLLNHYRRVTWPKHVLIGIKCTLIKFWLTDPEIGCTTKMGKVVYEWSWTVQSLRNYVVCLFYELSFSLCVGDKTSLATHNASWIDMGQE